jgi:hypothetical protein
MGVVALSTAAIPLGTVRSPSAKRQNGIALLKNATRSSGMMRLRGGRGTAAQEQNAPEKRGSEAKAQESDPGWRKAAAGDFDKDERGSPDSREKQKLEEITPGHAGLRMVCIAYGRCSMDWSAVDDICRLRLNLAILLMNHLTWGFYKSAR